MISADKIFSSLEKKRDDITSLLMNGSIPTHLTSILDVDDFCVWHAGRSEMNDAERRIHETGYLLDCTRARFFQCKGCERIALLSNKIHQHDPTHSFVVASGVRRGMQFKVFIEDFAEYDKEKCIQFNPLTNHFYSQQKIHDVLLHFIVQSLLEKKGCWNVERIYDAYLCGQKIITVKEDPIVNLGNFKATKSFARSAFCSMIQVLLHLKPYNFIFGGVNKDSFLVNSIQHEGTLGTIPYKSKTMLKIKDFSSSSIYLNETEDVENGVRMVSSHPLHDSVLRHGDCRIIKFEDNTFMFTGDSLMFERARHIHFGEDVNFALNIYLSLCALLSLPKIYDKVMEDETTRNIWISLFPHGEKQAYYVARECNESNGTSQELISILSKQDMYLEPIKLSYSSE